MPCRGLRLHPALVLLAAGAVVGLILYTPWHPRPFDVIDFSEFLPLFLRHKGFASRFQALVEYYAGDQGRLNLLPYWFLALKWSLFGWSTALWQTARFAQMMLIIVGVYALLRRLDTTASGAAMGALLYLSTTTATTAWTRLTMGEPLSMMFILVASLLACRYQEATRWRPIAVGIGLLSVGAIFSKEILIAAMPLPWYVACCRSRDGTLLPFRLTPRNVWLTCILGILMVGSLVPIALVAMNARTEGFALQYGHARMTPELLAVRWLGIMLPFWPSIPPSAAAIPTNLLFLLSIVLGWLVALQNRAERRSRARLLAAALALPTLGAIVYMPWPLLLPFYGFPFQLGAAMLLAVAITSLERRFPGGRGPVLACGCGVILGSALQAYYWARQSAARQEINYELALALPSFPRVDSGVIGAHVVFPESWRGPGPALRRYSQAVTGQSVYPRISNVRCDQLRELEEAGARRLRVSYSNDCGTLKHPDRSFVRYYRYLDWPSLARRTDSLRVDVDYPSLQP